MHDLVWDIETKPFSDVVLEEFFESKLGPCPEPQPFDPANVKHGRTKDEEKRAANEAAALEKHVLSQKKLVADWEKATENELEKFRNDAALSPVTGYVLAIGYWACDRKAFTCMAFGDPPPGADKHSPERMTEENLLEGMWATFTKARSQSGRIIGVNTSGFDLPFVINRSWLLDVDIPEWVFSIKGRYANYDEAFVDLQQHWLVGRGRGTSISQKCSFSWMASAFGTDGKPDGMTGDQFHEVWDIDRSRALEYLREDVSQPAFWAQRMGII